MKEDNETLDRLNADIMISRQVGTDFVLEIWFGILELPFRALTPCPDRHA